MANQGSPRTYSRAAATPEPARTFSLTAGIAAAVYFGISLIYLLPAFLPGQQVFGTDYMAGGYFFYNFISERFADGSLPKWVPYIFGGMPLFANPGSTFYPIHVLGDLLLTSAKILPFVFWFQFGIAGFGMYLLARELGCRSWVAFVAGLAYQFTGITMSWIYAGHDGRIIVASLAPLFFCCLHAGIRTGRVALFVGAAATLGFALLSFQIQLSYYLLLAAAIWAIFCLWRFREGRTPAGHGKVIALGLGAVALGFVMAAVNFLPFLDYMPESTRGQGEGRGYEYSITYSMSADEILSLAVPEQKGATVSDPTTGEQLFPEYTGVNGIKFHTEYVGALVVILLAVGGYYSRRNRYWWFFAALAVVFLSIALGGNTPLYRLYYELLPGTKRFRAPSLSFFVVAMALVTMAALTLERLASIRELPRGMKDEDDLQLAGWIALGVVGFGVLGALLANGTPAQAGMPTAAQGWLRFTLFAAGIAAVIWFWARGSLASPTTAVLLVLIGTLDLWSIDRRFFHTVGSPDEIFPPDDIITFLQRTPGPNRVWALPLQEVGAPIWGGGGRYGGDQPMLYGIEQVGGEHPNPLQRWNDFVGPGSEFYIEWQNLRSGLRIVGDTAVGFDSAPGFLDAANIRYVISPAPLAHAQLREVYRGSQVVYENPTALPRAYLVPSVREVAPGTAIANMRAGDWDPRQVAFLEAGAGVQLPATPLTGAAEVAEHEPDRVVVRTQADRPALLVLADNMYEGWEATVDGEPTPIHRTNHTFRGVVVPAGQHSVEFVFVPGSLYTGLWIYVASLLGLAAYGIYVLVASRRSRAAAPATG